MKAGKKIRMRGRLSGLDAMRGVAAALVVAFHIKQHFAAGWLLGKGNLGVDFFFVLSGYVMARTYEARFDDTLSPPKFMWIRLKRLWPTMAAATVFAIPVLAWFDPGIRGALFVAGLFLVPIPVLPAYFPLNSPQWSILFELLANAVHSVVLARLSVVSLLVVSAVSALVCIAPAMAAGGLTIGGDSATIWAGVPRVMMSYPLGIAIWRLWGDTPPLRLPSALTWALMPITLAAAAMIGGVAVDFAFVILCCPLIIIGALNLGESAFARLAGALSFPIYAFHIPGLLVAKVFGLPWQLGLALGIAMASLSAGAGYFRSRSAMRLKPTS